jgi:hypothetical protein
MDGYEFQCQLAIAELSGHPGYIELCRELDTQLQTLQQNVLLAKDDADILRHVRIWQAYSRAVDLVRSSPDRAREFLQQNQQTLGILEELSTN